MYVSILSYLILSYHIISYHIISCIHTNTVYIYSVYIYICIYVVYVFFYMYTNVGVYTYIYIYILNIRRDLATEMTEMTSDEETDISNMTTAARRETDVQRIGIQVFDHVFCI